MTKDFLGRGWSFPVRTDHQGNIKLEEGDENIERSVRAILSTAQGERVMRPDFGCRIHDQVYSSLSPATLNRIEDAVEEALVKWESRISIESIDARVDPDEPGKVIIDIDYWVESTNSSENMVYPFYLKEGQQ